MKSSKLLFYLLIFLAFSANAQDKDSILGLWLNHNQNVIVEIYEKGNLFYGKIHEIIEIPEDKAKGYSKSELEKGKQKMRGRHILTGLTFENGAWVNGQVHDPQNNSVKASCSISLTNHQKDLKIRFKKSLFSTTKTWTRFNDAK